VDLPDRIAGAGLPDSRGHLMCTDGVDLGHSCRLCGKPLLSCWDDGPSISWHANEADERACIAKSLEDTRRQAELERYACGQQGTRP